MWDYFKPLLIIGVVLGFAFMMTHSGVENTHGGYYRDNYYGGGYVGGVWIYSRGGMRARGGK
ncbi:MAG: hypothetical protein IEMM0008_1843 [bacterium]|nr:MAG: hypothetical protein IEMM0008_1843 [bacterium]